MARPIEFERDVVLRKAMKMFWQQGYKATSIKDIIDATSIQPGSLYGTFGNKQKLLLASLDYYFSDMKKLIKKTLYANNPPLENINNFFLSMSQHAEKNGIKNGCLLVNTILELSTLDKEAHKATSEMLLELESHFAEVLTKAKEEGEISNDKNPETLAKILVVTMSGLRVYSKANPKPQQQAIIVKELISMLKQ